ncbi:sensor domain-containing diguanylate cyclase [Vibrio sp. SCSIO 43137]|uniref:sensor domain-containing diguanylate cyclase n=1 Tax=Vibrio sp. SCSIO 43137 TaxID=3021011 RepID=UPI0023079547|nr:sensor domain-containing diguanylate cyclase [Vibrio sp. SCSIO 43137]WCE32137.1 sensor domain-containing diguanylate cyclase [Vibrio sp. SCSIO 43137]
MISPPKAPDENIRLNTLHSLNILDTDSEERFDRLTRLACRLLYVPIALVSLVDSNRQWFKSCYGLGVNETGRDVSFCGHAILGDGVFIINDALEDERFFDNPLVTGEPYIRFYAGVPLKMADNSKIGTLCIIDHKPRNLTDDEIKDLTDLAKMAEQELTAKFTAGVDELTGISNRRSFSYLSSKALQYCQTASLSASLIFFDLNKFKQINDEHGHQKGDEALITFAQLLVRCFRESDVIARIGGDEFVVLMPGATEKDSQNKLKRLEDELTEINSSGQFPFDITFCYGITQSHPEQAQDIEALIHASDEKMYCMKGMR